MTVRLRGVLAPVLTPFNQRLEPDVDKFIATMTKVDTRSSGG